MELKSQVHDSSCHAFYRLVRCEGESDERNGYLVASQVEREREDRKALEAAITKRLSIQDAASPRNYGLLAVPSPRAPDLSGARDNVLSSRAYRG